MLDEKRGHRCPLIILGGGRETLKEKGYGMYETNDAVLDPEASEHLRMFLPAVFPGKFGTNGTVEVEWVSNTVVVCQCEVTYRGVQTGIMGFTKTGDPFVSRLLLTSGSSPQEYHRLEESSTPTRSLLPGSTFVGGIQGMECLERMDGKFLFYTHILTNNLAARKRSLLLSGQIGNEFIGHHHGGSLDTILHKNSSKYTNVIPGGRNDYSLLIYDYH